MQGFKIQYSQICKYLGILGNIPRSDPDLTPSLLGVSLQDLRNVFHHPQTCG